MTHAFRSHPNRHLSRNSILTGLMVFDGDIGARCQLAAASLADSLIYLFAGSEGNAFSIMPPPTHTDRCHESICHQIYPRIRLWEMLRRP